MPTGTFTTDDDLTARAKIRRAAMRLFATHGYGTSIRTIAHAAGVSPALITHHFGTKEQLRQAVDDFVIRAFAERAAELDTQLEPAKLAQAMGEIWPAVIADQPAIRSYLRRSLLEGTDASIALFDELMAMVNGGLERLEQAGGVRAESDPLWRPYQVLFVILGPMLFEPFIQAHLDDDAFDAAVVARRSAANYDFVSHGLFQSTEPAEAPSCWG